MNFYKDLDLNMKITLKGIIQQPERSNIVLRNADYTEFELLRYIWFINKNFEKTCNIMLFKYQKLL
jgi:hypothetical protein